MVVVFKKGLCVLDVLLVLFMISFILVNVILECKYIIKFLY